MIEALKQEITNFIVTDDITYNKKLEMLNDCSSYAKSSDDYEFLCLEYEKLLQPILKSSNPNSFLAPKKIGKINSEALSECEFMALKAVELGSDKMKGWLFEFAHHYLDSGNERNKYWEYRNYSSLYGMMRKASYAI